MRRDVLALTFAMLFPSAIAATYFVALGGSSGEAGNPAVQFVYSFGKVIQFGFPVVYLLVVDRDALRRFSLNRRGLGLGVAFGLVVATAIVLTANWLAASILSEAPARVRAKVAEFGVARPGMFAGFAVFICLIHSLLEEYYWRWFVFARLRLMMPFGSAAVISGLGFMAHHVFVLNEYLPGHLFDAVVPFSLAIAVGGAFWAWLYERSGSLLGPWMSHMLVDAAIMFVGYRLVFG